MNKETGGPAFPCDTIVARDEKGHLYGSEISSGGMTLRDYFAAKAMQSIIAADGTYEYKNRAIEAYQAADAMMEARK